MKREKNVLFFLFLGPFLVLGPQKRVNSPNLGAILKKIIWNPIPYKILGKLLKFHDNWIINKKVIKYQLSSAVSFSRTQLVRRIIFTPLC